jgi:hypothetical protein
MPPMDIVALTLAILPNEIGSAKTSTDDEP